MNIIEQLNNKLKGIKGREREEIFYEIVLTELEKGYKKKGLLSKAIADSGGDESKVESIYIKYRVQSLKDEIKTKAANVQLKLKIENERRQKKLDEQDRREREKREAKSNEKIDSVAAFFIFGIPLIIFLCFIVLIVFK